jgi:cytochrome c oxidase cbb3-type subunit I/II
MSLEKFSYDNRTVKWFAYACISWGLIGMLAGLWAALALVLPNLNLGYAPTTAS